MSKVIKENILDNIRNTFASLYDYPTDVLGVNKRTAPATKQMLDKTEITRLKNLVMALNKVTDEILNRNNIDINEVSKLSAQIEKIHDYISKNIKLK